MFNFDKWYDCIRKFRLVSFTSCGSDLLLWYEYKSDLGSELSNLKSSGHVLLDKIITSAYKKYQRMKHPTLIWSDIQFFIVTNGYGELIKYLTGKQAFILRCYR